MWYVSVVYMSPESEFFLCVCVCTRVYMCSCIDVHSYVCVCVPREYACVHIQECVLLVFNLRTLSCKRNSAIQHACYVALCTLPSETVQYVG